MKVLEKGKGTKGWSAEAICTGKGNGNGGCGAKLLVEQADIYHTFQNARDESDRFNTFECPECGVETDINVPRNISDKLLSKKDWLEWRRSGGD